MPVYPHKKQNKIAYDQAESGFINIKKWEPPFMPVSTGFGFVGVLAEDSETGKLQCHECGKWFEQLPTHFSVKHGMTGEQYRAKFGLFTQTALKSKKLRLRQSEVITQLQKEGKMQLGNSNGYGFKKKNREAGNRKGKKKAKEGQNAYGICDLQIMTKIISLGKKLGKTPTLTDIKKEYGGGIITIMHYRYGSYIKYCRDYLKMQPNFSTYNPQFKTKKEWREHLIEVGLRGLEQGKELRVKKLLPENEGRYLYRYFKNFGQFKKEVLKLQAIKMKVGHY
jgi:hypothetical protein